MANVAAVAMDEPQMAPKAALATTVDMASPPRRCPPGLPPKQGLYDPQNEHDSCGVGFIVNLKGQRSHKLVDDAIVTVKGRVDKRDEVRVGFMALDVNIIEGLDTASSASLRLKVPSTSLNELKIHQIRKILRDHPGDSPVYLHIGHGKILRLADEFCVDLDRAVGELRMLLGHDAVML